MTEQTFILGKDAALEESIEKFQQKLTDISNHAAATLI